MGFRIRKSISLGQGCAHQSRQKGRQQCHVRQTWSAACDSGEAWHLCWSQHSRNRHQLQPKNLDEKPAKAMKTRNNAKQSKADTAQLPLTTAPVETTVMPYPSDANNLTSANTAARLKQRAFKPRQVNRPSNRWKAYDEIQAAKLLETVDHHHSRCHRGARHWQHERGSDAKQPIQGTAAAIDFAAGTERQAATSS